MLPGVDNKLGAEDGDGDGSADGESCGLLDITTPYETFWLSLFCLSIRPQS